MKEKLFIGACTPEKLKKEIEFVSQEMCNRPGLMITRKQGETDNQLRKRIKDENQNQAG